MRPCTQLTRNHAAHDILNVSQQNKLQENNTKLLLLFFNFLMLVCNIEVVNKNDSVTLRFFPDLRVFGFKQLFFYENFKLYSVICSFDAYLIKFLKSILLHEFKLFAQTAKPLGSFPTNIVYQNSLITTRQM